MATIVLHGDLTQFGGPYNWDVSSPAEAVRALCHQIKGFRRHLPKGNYHVIRKNKYRETDLDEKMLNMVLHKGEEIHFVPVVAGAKNSGPLKIIIGVVLIAVSIYLGGSTAPAGLADLGISAETVASVGTAIGGMGLAMVIAGISQIISPTPKTANPNPSFLFNGPGNISQQGVPIPLVYGRFICGSVTPVASIQAESLASAQPVGTGGPGFILD